MKLRNQLIDVVVSVVIVGCIFYMAARDPPPPWSLEIQFFNYLMNVEGACFMGTMTAAFSGVFANLLVCKSHIT